jgi:hypothetical protein
MTVLTHPEVILIWSAGQKKALEIFSCHKRTDV